MCFSLFSSNYARFDYAEYLKPTNDALKKSEKQEMFSARNRMTNIPNNFPKQNSENNFLCGEKENMVHISKLQIQIEVFKQVKQNLEKKRRKV